MRKFHSYEEVNPDIHYYVPREELIERAYRSLIGEESDDDGHYITVWGPRQSGKTWIMRQVVKRLMTLAEAETKSPTETKLPTEIEVPFEVAILTMQAGKTAETEAEILTILQQKLSGWFDRALPPLKDWSELEQFFL